MSGRFCRSLPPISMSAVRIKIAPKQYFPSKCSVLPLIWVHIGYLAVSRGVFTAKNRAERSLGMSTLPWKKNSVTIRPRFFSGHSKFSEHIPDQYLWKTCQSWNIDPVEHISRASFPETHRRAWLHPIVVTCKKSLKKLSFFWTCWKKKFFKNHQISWVFKKFRFSCH